MRVIEAGFKFFQALDEHNARHRDRALLQMRLGVHTGPAVAGVIGTRKLRMTSGESRWRLRTRWKALRTWQGAHLWTPPTMSGVLWLEHEGAAAREGASRIACRRLWLSDGYCRHRISTFNDLV